MKDKGRKILNYIKFTKKELDNYVADTTSCIEKVNNTIHMGFPPYGMVDFKNTLLDIINKQMIGFFDDRLNGIVLDAKNIKVLSTQWPIYNDSPELHIDVNADFYVFKPQIGATITGMVNHVTKTHIGVIIYRVFNVTIRLTDGHQDDIENTEIKFTVKKFDLQNNLPYIEGILITNGRSNKTKFDDFDNENENTDSGISTEINEDKKFSKIKKFSTGSNESDSEDNETTVQSEEKKSVSFNLSQNKFRSPSPFVKREHKSSESSVEIKTKSNSLENSLNSIINEFCSPNKPKKSKTSKNNLDVSLTKLFDEITVTPVKKEKTKKFKSNTSTPNINDMISSVCSEIKEEKLSDTESPKIKKKSNKKSFNINDTLAEVISSLKTNASEKESEDTGSPKKISKKRKAEVSLNETYDSPSMEHKKKRNKSLNDLSSALFAEYLDKK